jgi:3-hydroxyacyl-CoA dehydrogenase
MVIEAVVERMELKQKVFTQLGAACKPTAVLCTNTSTLDVDAIASATKRPDRCMGMHFFRYIHKFHCIYCCYIVSAGMFVYLLI